MQDETVTVVIWPAADKPPEGAALEDVLSRRAGGALVWVDVVHPAAPTMQALADRFGLHPLAVQDVLHGFQAPKVIDYETHLFVVWHVLMEKGGRDHKGGRSELDAFVGPDFVVTASAKPLDAVAQVSEVVRSAQGLVSGRSDWLLHSLLDTVVDSYFPVLETVSDSADRLEEVMFERPRTEDLQELFRIKHRLIAIRRSVTPERDAMAYLARRESVLIGKDAFPYFQDVYDHLNRIVDTIDVSRDIVQGGMDIYLSSVNNRLNEVMKQLTVVATIALPVTVVSSFFGMNFLWMVNSVKSPWAFWAAVAAMVGVALGLYSFIRRKGW